MSNAIDTPRTAPTPAGPTPPRPRREQAPWVTVMTREMLVKLTDKGFLISTALTLALVLGTVAAAAWFAAKPETTKLAVVSAQGERVAQAMDAAARAANAESSVKPVMVADVAAGEALLRDGDADALLVEQSGSGPAAWQLVAKGAPSDTVMALAKDTLTQLTVAGLAEQAGMSVAEVQRQSTVEPRSLEVDNQRALIARALGGVFSVLFLMAAMTYGMQIATSVLEEKQSRIVEILVAAIPVRHLLAGKVLGNTLMALGQMALLVGVGLLGATLTPMKDVIPSLGAAVGWYLLLFLAGFLALACIWAAAGALGTRSEDLQHTSQPLIFILMGCYLAGFFAEGTWRVVLSFVPVISTILMPVRVVEGTAPWWQLVLALLIDVAFAAVTVWLGSTVYRRAILRTHKRLSFRAALAQRD